MRIPISLLYDDYLELEKKIEADPFDDPSISERYYNELMVNELDVISHPDYNDFMAYHPIIICGHLNSYCKLAFTSVGLLYV